ncbi:MAG TPA: POTRA domain-containing protein [Terracidiphilus sp.]|nr:POTRA domain-containing protein [Terracidiphilus sp.]
MRISIEGVSEVKLGSLRGNLPQTEGAPLDPGKVADSLRTLYATGLFDSVEAVGQPDGAGVALIFRGTPRFFIGTVTVDGARGATVNTQLERAGRLDPGTRFTQAKMTTAVSVMREVLAQNGYFESGITYDLTPHQAEQLTDISFHVASGPQARVGAVTVTGDSGLSPEAFRRAAHLRAGAAVTRDTVSRALGDVLKVYQKQGRLEAEIKLTSQTYAAHKVNYTFSSTRGPVVRVVFEGANPGEDRIKRLIPIYEEGTVDDDLLNEGNRRVRDYYQSVGFFDVTVEHKEEPPRPDEVLIVYNVNLGPRRKVETVSVAGNHYFGEATLKQLLSVRAVSPMDRHGIYSQALVSADVAALTGVYQSNGFANVKVTPEMTAGNTPQEQGEPAEGSAPIGVVYRIEEGPQQRVGTVALEGNNHIGAENLLPLLNTEQGQLLSPRNLASDRDMLATEYMRRGFQQARVEVEEKNDAQDPNRVGIVFRIHEGRQVFVSNVLLTGLHYTRPATAARAITMHPGDPLSQAALEETQRNLYEFALFNEVNVAVENPNGAETHKTVLLQTTEARRWTFSYGAGFEVQTGAPQNGCQGYIAAGVQCSPNGRTGVSPRVLLALTRNNLFGREQSASIQGNYGLLEQKIDLIYDSPHLKSNRNFDLSFNGGYANSQDVTTYVASRIEAGFRLTEKVNGSTFALSRANTFIYGYDFRRVKVAEDTLQVFPDFVPVLSAAVRVGGPSFTWLRDTRDNPVDAHRGTYTSFEEFFSASPFGAEADFNRIDTTWSSYYGIDKNKFVIARNTRYGDERAFGNRSSELIPLPERLYAGGATSLRSFSINAAGPRDPDTGFPIGGAGALVNNTEVRLPPTPLPYFGNAVSFVLFHDMGNVFANAGDIWKSAIRTRQPDKDTCKMLTPPKNGAVPPPTANDSSLGPLGTCSFSYFSHAPGVGVRYHTPVGPIRMDFSYTLNPPIFPVNVDFSQSAPFSNQHVGEAGHFNFFFSLGQNF